MLSVGADDVIALTAPGRPPLTYAGLRVHCDRIARQLASQGLDHTDRVAIVLSNGPEMASAFLAVAGVMSAAPLNPAYKQSEYAFYLEDLAPKLVIVAAGSTNPVREAATALGIQVVETDVPDGAPAGIFSLFDTEADIAPATDDHEALVLHTSGTTSRPKVVPLLQRNIAASARNIAASLELSSADHCLNIMPLFPHSWFDRGPDNQHVTRGIGMLYRWLQCAEIPGSGTRRSHHLVFRRTDDASGYFAAGKAPGRPG
jgi:acyl-CoA synthetase (AMP-forming)/AMP-acid ligase II